MEARRLRGYDLILLFQTEKSPSEHGPIERPALLSQAYDAPVGQLEREIDFYMPSQQEAEDASSPEGT